MGGGVGSGQVDSLRVSRGAQGAGEEAQSQAPFRIGKQFRLAGGLEDVGRPCRRARCFVLDQGLNFQAVSALLAVVCYMAVRGLG